MEVMRSKICKILTSFEVSLVQWNYSKKKSEVFPKKDAFMFTFQSKTENTLKKRLKIEGFEAITEVSDLRFEKFQKMVDELGAGEQYKVPEDGALPPGLSAQRAKAKEETTTQPTAPALTKPMGSTTSTTIPPTPAATVTTPNISPPPAENIATLENTTAPKPKPSATESQTTLSPPPATTSPATTPTNPTIAITRAREGAVKPYKPKREEALNPDDFATNAEGFGASITPSVSETSDSRIVSEVPVNTSNFVPRIKQLPKNYTGYRIEFFNAPFELPSSHEIFAKHGNITVEQKKDGTYAYLLGDFSDWRDANKFLTNILLQRYPDARVVRYKRGNRLI